MGTSDDAVKSVSTAGSGNSRLRDTGTLTDRSHTSREARLGHNVPPSPSPSQTVLCLLSARSSGSVERYQGTRSPLGSHSASASARSVAKSDGRSEIFFAGRLSGATDFTGDGCRRNPKSSFEYIV